MEGQEDPEAGQCNCYKGGCQNEGPFLGTLNIRCRIILRAQTGTLILTTTHIHTTIMIPMAPVLAIITIVTMSLSYYNSSYKIYVYCILSFFILLSSSIVLRLQGRRFRGLGVRTEDRIIRQLSAFRSYRRCPDSSLLSGAPETRRSKPIGHRF